MICGEKSLQEKRKMGGKKFFFFFGRGWGGWGAEFERLVKCVTGILFWRGRRRGK